MLLSGQPAFGAYLRAPNGISHGDIARIPTQDLRTAQAFKAFFFTVPED